MGKRIRDLTVAQVEALLGQLASVKPPTPAQRRRGGYRRPLGKSSLTRVRTCLGAALSEAQRRGLVAQNVAQLALLPTAATKPKPRRSLSQVEARRLLKAATGRRDEALYLVAIMLGLRPGEVLGLSWRAVDLHGQTLDVFHAIQRLPGGKLVIGPPKKNSYRTLRLPPDVVDALRAHAVQQKRDQLAAPVWDDHNLVFPSAIGTPMDPSNLRRSVRELCVEAGVKPIAPNELRHSAGSLLVAAGVPLQEVADMLGHRDIRMLAQVYRHKLGGVVDVREGQAKMLQR